MNFTAIKISQGNVSLILGYFEKRAQKTLPCVAVIFLKFSAVLGVKVCQMSLNFTEIVLEKSLSNFRFFYYEPFNI